MLPISQTILYTDVDGFAKFRDAVLSLSEGKPEAMLSPLQASSGFQFRQSPVGFKSSFHCTTTPQWLIVLSGAMEIFLQDGSSRIFKAGESFFSNDTLPMGAAFDPKHHGHASRQVGDVPLVTMFVRT
ncbi:MAG TPA: hypothetical protein PKC80_10340 [Burkholderiaceae bacterium]|nr:hypothetical protein [Burkholderiaceae bacterium]